MEPTPHKDSPGIKALKIGVIATGIFLVFGACAMTVAILIKARMSATPPKQVTTLAPSSLSTSSCPPLQGGTIPITGTILTSHLQNTLLTVTSSKQVLVIDTCSGKIQLNVQAVGQ